MGQTSRFLSRLRRAVLARDGSGLSDAQLLGRFVERRDEAAFEALLRRHGPMVFGVCRRILGNSDDAHDAFQATFLVFVRKAASLASRAAVGGWLHGVAYRTALEARSRRARRRLRERQVEEMPQGIAEPDDDLRELLALLDRELSRLPEKYRVPVVLCELEGKSRKDAARELKLPEGTLSSRLAMARKLLAKRLARYGPGVSGAVLAAAASASVPASLLTSTVKAAGQTLASAKVVALTEGVMKAMLLSKLKVVWTVVAAVGVSAAAIGITYRAAAQSSAPTSGVVNKAQPPGAGRAAADDLESLRLEMEALRKEVRALRERVKSLEAEQVREQKQRDLREREAALESRLKLETRKLEQEQEQIRKRALEALGRSRVSPDPAAEAEAALKKLLKNPNDKEATEALERALKRLKEKPKPQHGLPRTSSGEAGR